MEPRDIQRLLAASNYYAGGIDGDFGPKSNLAVTRVLQRNKPEALKWSAARQRVAAAQIILDAAGYEPGEVDGYAGHNTKEAFNAWDYVRTNNGKKEVLPGRAPEEIEKGTTLKKGKWPTQKEVPGFFGPAGSRLATAGTVQLPIPFRIAWNLSQKVKTFKCHEKVAEPLTTIYEEAVRQYGEKRFQELGLDIWGGCFNDRTMRGGSLKSMHAYGIAVDHDPERNQLRWGRDRAEFAKTEYNAWWAIVEATGAVSLGRARNYDWMHFQFATL